MRQAAGSFYPSHFLSRSSSSIFSSSFPEAAAVAAAVVPSGIQSRRRPFPRLFSLHPFIRHNVEHLSFTPSLPLHRTTTTTTTPSPNPIPESNVATTKAAPKKKKDRRKTPEFVLRGGLNMCSKNSDLPEALRLYDEARAAGVPIAVDEYSIVLYLCAMFPRPLGISRGFEIFHQMAGDGVAPNEAALTSMSRLAAADGNPRLAYQLIDEMHKSGIAPKLRSYGPSLLGFCERGDFDGALEVEDHMAAMGVLPEEAELAALLRVNAEAGRGEATYRILHRLRALVRQVSESTAEIVERWFRSDAAREAGTLVWDAEKVREGVAMGGGGWHGQGWLGKGRWSVGRSKVDPNGFCKKCGMKLVSIDINPSEFDSFQESLSSLAVKAEKESTGFLRFQDWLQHNGPFDFVIDAANIGLLTGPYFSVNQVKRVVEGLRRMFPSKKVLVIIHPSRMKYVADKSSYNFEILEAWLRSRTLYCTPYAANVDWYWLYAAVYNRCLVVTNDEMRDHLFDLLGSIFFPKWKEKHQVKVTFDGGKLAIDMPPPYSVVIQESECGSWHVPMVVGDDTNAPRKWVCATRSDAVDKSSSSIHGARRAQA